MLNLTQIAPHSEIYFISSSRISTYKHRNGTSRERNSMFITANMFPYSNMYMRLCISTHEYKHQTIETLNPYSLDSNPLVLKILASGLIAV